MSLPLTPERLAATYECLRTFPPFCHWKLPECSEMHFQVTKQKDREGQYTRYVRTKEHIIAISGVTVGYFHTLAVVMAHEMIHLKQAVAKTETPGVEHNAEFRRLSRRVCRAFGWDPKIFVYP